MRPFFIFFLLFSLASCSGQADPPTPEGSITYFINDNVTNAEEDYAVAIIDNWKTYLANPQYYGRENDFWSSDQYPLPDYAYINMLLYVYQAQRAGRQVQCTVLGVQPKGDGVYQLKTMYSGVEDSTGRVKLEYIASVYAREKNGKYQFFGTTEYLKGQYEVRQVGRIEYLIHPEHDFQLAEAEKMAAFNWEIAEVFGREPLSFGYVVANNTNDLSLMWGLEFTPYSMNPVPSGGLADTRNNVLYAGNNAAYYPHELVHLYTSAGWRGQHHAWVDEGIAALYGGSTGYYIEWHWQKLKVFLADNPDYPLEALTALEKDIPNGEYTSDFRYAIGAYLMHKVREKEGVEGLFSALASGRSEEEYFAMLKDKLGVEQADFGAYMRREMAELPGLSAEIMATLKY